MFVFLRNLLILYIISGILFLVVGFLFYLFTDKEALTGMTYNQAFTFHFFIMIFLFIVPAIPSLVKSAFGRKQDENDR